MFREKKIFFGGKREKRKLWQIDYSIYFLLVFVCVIYIFGLAAQCDFPNPVFRYFPLYVKRLLAVSSPVSMGVYQLALA